ncbi:MAG: SDR family oxidoreductase [Caldilineaceae bacterium]|nr:SDR family oxidoreductase [Caldilineaceae bacterium]
MSLRIVVFGANGPTGRIVTRKALAAGYSVTAVTRHPDRFGQQHEQLRVVYGDVYEPSTIAAAIEDQDAVLSMVGVPYSWKPITVYSQSATAIIDGMQAAGVRRLVCTSSGGTNPDFDLRGEGFFFSCILKPTIGRTLYQDMRLQEQIVMGSDLDWTIARPAQLVTHPAGTSYQLKEAYVVPGGRRTAYTDLADFLLSAISDERYERKAVAIASPI